MKKLILIAGCIVLLVSDCAVPNRLSKKETLFEDMNRNYPLANYAIMLQKGDTLRYLSKAVLADDGKIRGEEVNRYRAKEKLIFTVKPEVSLTSFIQDTGEKNQIAFSREDITKVELVKKHVGRDKRVIYDEFWSEHRSALIFKLIMLFLLACAGIALAFLGFIYLMSVILGSACYIATMVYGSYDAPQVWVLRKYRDEKLAPFFWGRVFIRLYYAVSPLFVFLFKRSQAVNRLVKFFLDRWLKKLDPLLEGHG